MVLSAVWEDLLVQGMHYGVLLPRGLLGQARLPRRELLRRGGDVCTDNLPQRELLPHRAHVHPHSLWRREVLPTDEPDGAVNMPRRALLRRAGDYRAVHVPTRQLLPRGLVRRGGVHYGSLLPRPGGGEPDELHGRGVLPLFWAVRARSM